MLEISLVREKVTVTSDQGPLAATEEATVICSNRILLQFDDHGKTENLVIRGQNMPCTLRMAAKCAAAYYYSGSFLEREEKYNWEKAWDKIVSTYEKAYNDINWMTVYLNGEVMFTTQKSPFVDIIEKCALISIDNYENTIQVTQDAMKEVGRNVDIQRKANIAVMISDDGKRMVCGIMQRITSGNTSFSMVAQNGLQTDRFITSMDAAAALLEEFNLYHYLKRIEKDLDGAKITKDHEDFVQVQAALGRQKELNISLNRFEDQYRVIYKPDRPKFYVRF